MSLNVAGLDSADVTVGSLAIASIAPTETAAYTHYGVVGSGIAASVDLAPVISGTLSEGSLRYNGSAGATYLDWTSAIDVDSDGTAETVTVNTTAST